MNIEQYRRLCESLGGEFSIEPNTRVHAFIVPMFVSGAANVYVCKVGDTRIEFDGNNARIFYSEEYPDKIAPDVSDVIVKHITDGICTVEVRPEGFNNIVSGIVCDYNVNISGDLYEDNTLLLRALDRFKDAKVKAKDYMNKYGVVLLKHWGVEV